MNLRLVRDVKRQYSTWYQFPCIMRGLWGRTLRLCSFGRCITQMNASRQFTLVKYGLLEKYFQSGHLYLSLNHTDKALFEIMWWCKPKLSPPKVRVSIKGSERFKQFRAEVPKAEECKRRERHKLLAVDCRPPEDMRNRKGWRTCMLGWGF